MFRPLVTYDQGGTLHDKSTRGHRDNTVLVFLQPLLLSHKCIDQVLTSSTAYDHIFSSLFHNPDDHGYITPK